MFSSVTIDTMISLQGSRAHRCPLVSLAVLSQALVLRWNGTYAQEVPPV